MFLRAAAFDSGIGNWDVSNVRDMSRMFDHARSFDQDLQSWDVLSVKSMEIMFALAGTIFVLPQTMLWAGRVHSCRRQMAI